jgi:muramoyltetrapeptide carboxypeptidase
MGRGESVLIMSSASLGAAKAAPPAGAAPLSLTLFSPAGAVSPLAPLRRAVKRLGAMGFSVELDEAALARHQRFAGDDDTRLAALHRVADQAPDVALATRGGYGLTRLLDRIDWPRLARSVERGTRWVGHSDLTALQLGLLAHTGATSWAGPMAVSHFGRAVAEGGVDEVTADCFGEAMRGELEGVGFRTAPGFDGLEVAGRLWGGNLTVLLSLLGTPHWPRRAVRGGILFIEDIDEHPYRIERMLLQLQQAGVLEQQKAVLVGAFTGWRRGSNDRGFGLATVLDHLRSRTSVPLLTGLPFGHVPTLLSLPVGQRITLMVQGREVLMVG